MNLRDVVRHMFLDPEFARGAGTRTTAFKCSPYYAQVDQASGGLLSQWDSSLAPGGCGSTQPRQSADRESGQPSLPAPVGTASLPIADDVAMPGEGIAQSDPLDEVRTGDGAVMVLLFALFCDGVQLHQKSQSTTVVITLKCLDQPGFLVGKLVSSFNIAFIGGPQEPTCMKDFVAIFVQQFGQFVTGLGAGAAGVSPLLIVQLYALASCNAST